MLGPILSPSVYISFPGGPCPDEGTASDLNFSLLQEVMPKEVLRAGCILFELNLFSYKWTVWYKMNGVHHVALCWGKLMSRKGINLIN